MKRFLMLFAAVSMTLVVMAQNQMATLSHEGELTSFTGMYSLQEAYEAAETGDFIYLSEGDFVTKDGERLLIEKDINIVGSGYGSNIIPEVRLYFSIEDHISSGLGFSFDGVRINTLSFNSFDGHMVWPGSVNVKNCWINELKRGSFVNELHIDRCRIDALSFGQKYADGSVSYGTYDKTFITNSKIGATKDEYSSYQVTNCNIQNAENTLPETVYSSIIEYFSIYDSKYHQVYNSLFLNPIENSMVITHDCYFENPENGLLDENLNVTIDLKERGYIGLDKDIIGVYGGTAPFTENPSVPTIDPVKSSVEFDSESNQLNVTITLLPN